MKPTYIHTYIAPLASVRTSQRTRSVSFVTTNGMNVSRPECKISNVFIQAFAKTNSIKINIKITEIK